MIGGSQNELDLMGLNVYVVRWDTKVVYVSEEKWAVGRVRIFGVGGV